MFPSIFRNQRQQRELEFAHEFAATIKKRLLLATALGFITVVTTGINAAFGYYARELPQSIRDLTSSVTDLKKVLSEQVEINEKQDDRVDGIESRVTRLEKLR